MITPGPRVYRRLEAVSGAADQPHPPLDRERNPPRAGIPIGSIPRSIMAEATRKSVTTVPASAAQDSPVAAKAAAQPALRFERFFSKATVSPYDEVQGERRTAPIRDAIGKKILEEKDV